VRVRRWDEGGKDPTMVTHSREHFLAIAARCLHR
jgi:predicted HD phosphohydrolase